MKILKPLILLVVLSAAGLAAFAAVLFFSGYCVDHPRMVRAGQKILFLGADVEQDGVSSYPNGYIHLVSMGLKADGTPVKTEFVGSNGSSVSYMVSGASSCLTRSADWVVIHPGASDLWNKKVTLEKFRDDVSEILRKAQCSCTRPVLMTFSANGLNKDMRNTLEARNEAIREIAHLCGLPLVDWERFSAEYLKNNPLKQIFLPGKSGRLTRLGNRILAAAVLEELGVPVESVARYVKQWETHPETTRLNLVFTPEEWAVLQAGAKRGKVNAEKLARQALDTVINSDKSSGKQP